MDRRTPLLVNSYEIATDEALNEAAARAGLRVCTKVKLSDALDIRGSRLTYEEFEYATRAHLDFVVTDEPENRPQFAVEFDGRRHRTDPGVQRKDALKNKICKQLGLQLLRIDSDFLRRRRRFTLVGWLVEVWAMERAFYEAQRAGGVPHDEPFCYFSVLDPRPDGSSGWLSLDGEGREQMALAFREGLAPDWVPEERTSRHPFDDGEPEQIEAFAIFRLHRDRYIIGYARLRNFALFGGVHATQLAADLAVADAGVLLKRYMDGEIPATTREELAALDERTQDWWRQGAVIGPWSFSLQEHRARQRAARTH
jgi:very-short-patch-repair endonuclease